MPLTDSIARNAKPAAKTVRIFDHDGLYLEVSPRGGKWWRLKYRFAGKEKRVSLGVYPEVNLKKARARTIEARQLLDAGVDPSENRRAAKAAQMDGAANSFEVVTREWIEQQMKTWVEGHGERILTRFERDIFPVDRRPSDCGSDRAGTADDGEAHRKTRRAGDCASGARQLRPGVPLRHRHRPRQTRSHRRSARRPPRGEDPRTLPP